MTGLTFDSLSDDEQRHLVEVEAEDQDWRTIDEVPTWVPHHLAVEIVTRNIGRFGPRHQMAPTPPGRAGAIPALALPAPTIDSGRSISGGSFIFDQPDGVPAVWGSGDDVLWAKGEAFWLVGPPGVGKTTLVGQLVRGRVGLSGTAVDWPIEAGSRRVLYLAMDRPAQIARSLRRHFTPEERAVLDERLQIWKGPPPIDVARQPSVLVDLCRHFDADTLIIDSVKDAAIKLSDDEVGSAFNRAIQGACVEGIEVACLHHQRKGQGGEKPTSLEAVYGSTWLTAGAGSVILLWGAAGDPIVELKHLKQPVAEVGPLKLLHDHDAGRTTVERGFDPLAFLRHRRDGATVKETAAQMFDKNTPTEVERKKAQRRLDKLVLAGHARRTDPIKGGAGGSQPARYYATTDADLIAS